MQQQQQVGIDSIPDKALMKPVHMNQAVTEMRLYRDIYIPQLYRRIFEVESRHQMLWDEYLHIMNDIKDGKILPVQLNVTDDGVEVVPPPPPANDSKKKAG